MFRPWHNDDTSKFPASAELGDLQSDARQLHPPVRSSFNFEHNYVDPQGVNTGFFNGVTAGSTGSTYGLGAGRDDGIPAVLQQDQGVLNPEQQKALYRAWGPRWRDILEEKAIAHDSGVAKGSIGFRAAQEKAKLPTSSADQQGSTAEPVLLHGKEVIISGSESNYLAETKPSLVKIGERGARHTPQPLGSSAWNERQH